MNTSDSTIKRWLNELADENWVKVIVDRNENNEVIERRIYINLNTNLNTFLNEPTPGVKNELYKNTNNRKRKEIYKESKTNQQPSHWRERLRIAIRQGLVDKQEAEISEWKYLQRSTKQILETIDIEAIHQKEKEKELQKLYELNCVANINPYTWRNMALQHFSEEELGFRDLDDYNVPNTQYYKVWQWLVRYGESLKKPDIHQLPIKDKIQLYQHWGKIFKRNE